MSTPDAAPGGLPFTQLGHYQILAQIGGNQLGNVYRGYEPALDRVVAIKVLPPSLTTEPALVKRFRAEAEAAARLEHPQIVQIYFVGEDEGRHFFAMEFIDGESLARRLDSQPQLSFDEAASILEQCLAGLQAAHEAGVVHRDVNPTNILMDPKRRRAVLSNFGLAKSLESASRNTSTQLAVGSADYLSPEQARGGDVDGRSDLYSLGVVAFQMLSGRLPFRGEDSAEKLFQHVYVAPPDLAEAVPGVSPALSRIVMRLLAKAPQDRYAHAGEALNDVRAFRAGRPLPSESPPVPQRHRRAWVVPALQLLLVGGLFLVAAWVLWDKNSVKDIADAAAIPEPPPVQRSEGTLQPPAQIVQNKPLRDAIDQAFEQPAADLLPGVVIFPVTEFGNSVSEDGTLTALLAMTDLAYRPKRRMKSDPHFTEHVLREARALETGAELDEPMVRKCLAALGNPMYVLVRRDEQPQGGWNLTLSLRGGGKQYPDRDLADIYCRQRLDAPRLIIRGVLEWLNQPVSEPDFASPIVTNHTDFGYLRRLLRRSDPIHDGDLQSTARSNPQSPLIWGRYLEEGTADNSTLRLLMNLSQCRENEYVAFGVARQQSDLDRSAAGLEALIPLAPTHRDNAWYYQQLATTSLPLNDDKLTSRLLELWKQNTTGYDAFLTRGTFLIDWALHAREQKESAAATTGGPTTAQRLEMARDELQRAVAVNPLDWLAHTQLIRAANAMGLPRKFVEEHFAAALKNQPRSLSTYREKMAYLEPQAHGTPEELLAFAQDCAATGHWEELIPQLAIEAVERLCFDPKTGRFDYSRAALPGVWQTAQALHHSAAASDRPADKRASLNFLMRCGVRGGHAAELEDLAAGPDARRDDTVFRYGFEHDYARDLIAAHASSPEPLAAVRIALAEGDSARAAELLQTQELATALSPEWLSQSQAALKLGQTLFDSKTLALSPTDIVETFTGSFPAYGHVAGENAVCHVLREAVILFPIGLPGRTITGTINWSPEITIIELLVHTRAQRDPLHVVYWPEQGIVHLRRNEVLLEKADCPPGPHAFRLELGTKTDRLEPLPGVIWEVPAESPVPSGFGFRAGTSLQAGTITLSNLKIELKD